MKVMYFAFEGFDSDNGSNHLSLKMMDTLLKRGHDVYYLAGKTTGNSPEIPALLQGRNGFDFDIVPRKVVSKNSFVRRYFDGLSYSLRALRRWRRKIAHVDCVILQSTHTVVFSSVLLRYFYKGPVIFNSFDVFPDGMRDNGVISNGLVYRILHRLQQIVYRNSSRVIAISEDMKNSLVGIGVGEDKIDVVHNWYDEDGLKQISTSQNRFYDKYEFDKSKLIVQYAGNFGYTFDYKMVLDVAEILKSNENIVFHMIGSGAREEQFKKEAQDRALGNIIFFPWQPLDIIYDIYQSCDIALIPLTKGVIYYSFPSKGSLLMASSKVIVCSIESESLYYSEINDRGVGVCCDRSSPGLVAEAILELSADEEKRTRIGRKASAYAQEEYSSMVNMDRLLKVVDSCIMEGRGSNVR